MTEPGGYAIVVSAKTHKDSDWRRVVEALEKKYVGAQVVDYNLTVREVKPTLAKLLPRYTCFVGQPSEVGRDFVVQVHRLTRGLNDDPYGDTLWGIVTGYTVDDALAMASCNEPLLIRRGVGIGLNLAPFEEAWSLSDGRKGVVHTKGHDGKVTNEECGDRDQAIDFSKHLSEFKPDCLGSDGHASERDLQMAFGRGQLRCRAGQLLAVDLDHHGRVIDSPNPKVYLAYGNCLIGHVDGPDAIALAFMHSAGVRQMVGYTVVTWYGKSGWGAGDWFFGQPGRFSFSEAFFISQQRLLHDLRERFPTHADYEIDPEDYDREGRYLGRIAAKLGHKPGEDQATIRDELGMLWDRDTVAFYGDPAWDARFPDRKLDWDQQVKRHGQQFELSITPDKDGEIGAVFAFLPERVSHALVLEGKELKPVIGSFFVMVPKVGKVKKGQVVKVRFEDKKA